jgi:hypothetical protein
MRDTDDADAARLQLPHHTKQSVRLVVVERSRRLVKNQDRRAQEKRLTDFTHLSLRTRELCDFLVEIDSKADLLEHRLRLQTHA